MSIEGFISLQIESSKKVAQGLNETSKQSLERHTQKFVRVAQTSLPKWALLKDQIRFLLNIEYGAKARQPTKSLVCGKVKATSYEDLVSKRVEREGKEQVKEKGKENHAVVVSTFESDMPEPDRGDLGRKRKTPLE
ncbi:MAG: hypothetical protein Q9165_007364 [Trypethelium subeluteriae]